MSSAGAATQRAAILPPKPGGPRVSGGGGDDGGGSINAGAGGLLPPSSAFSVSGGGGGEGGREGGGEGGSEGAASATLPPPAAWVSRLQRDLSRLGYFDGPFTGVYGPLTTAAVRQFQAANGLAADGRWGPASQAALTRRLGAGATTLTAASTSSSPLPPPAAWVSRLQRDLSRLGYFSGPFTGVYGPLTTAAVKQFQATNGLAADGRWGPASQAMLMRRLASRG